MTFPLVVYRGGGCLRVPCDDGSIFEILGFMPDRPIYKTPRLAVAKFAFLHVNRAQVLNRPRSQTMRKRSFRVARETLHLVFAGRVPRRKLIFAIMSR